MSEVVDISVMSAAAVRNNPSEVIRALLTYDKVIVTVHGVCRAAVEFFGAAVAKRGHEDREDDNVYELSRIEELIRTRGQERVRYLAGVEGNKPLLLVTILTEKDSAELIHGAMTAWANENLTDEDRFGPIRAGKIADELLAELRAQEARKPKTND